MNQVSTIRELYAFDDWATHRVIAAAAPLANELLDREFNIGLKSLRGTLLHTYSAKQIWIERIRVGVDAKWEKLDGHTSIEQLRTLDAALNQRYAAHFQTLNDASLERRLDYRDMRGHQHNSRPLDVLLHVANHGVYHRAQASNMLRHVGAKPPRVDYIFRYFEQSELPPPNLSRQAVQYYFMATDWARDLALDAAANLTDEQLDRPFEMGVGTIRGTFSHTEDAERWWLQNWIGEAAVGFPKPSKTNTIDRLRDRFNETAQRRNALIESLRSDDELKRIVEAKPAADRTIRFPLGVTMLQLCTHGTHHRAQVFNMLKRVGGTVPGNDLILMTRTPAS